MSSNFFTCVYHLFKSNYGNKFYDLLRLEFKKAIPNAKGLSHQNLRYTEKFYTMYKNIFPQVVGELVLVPWGHHRIIIYKCKTILFFFILTKLLDSIS